MVLEWIANPSIGESRFLSSSLSRTAKQHAGIAQLVEHFLAKEDVESSSLFARSMFIPR